MSQILEPKEYDFIWKVDNFTYLQNSYWLKETEYYRRDFIVSGDHNKWKVYLGKGERDRLGDVGVLLIDNLDNFREKVYLTLDLVQKKFTWVDEKDLANFTIDELKTCFLELIKCVQELIGIYFYTEFFCFDKIQEKVEKLGLSDKEYLTSSPLENIVSLERYERLKLAKNPTDGGIRTFLEKFDIVPWAEGKPKWNEQSLKENLQSLHNVKKKIDEIEKNHHEIITHRRANLLTDQIRELQELKFYVRIFFNKVFFPNNIMDKVVKIISERIGKSFENLQNCHVDEIIMIMEGNKFKLPDRTFYVLGKFNGWQEILGNEALTIINDLEDASKENIRQLEGHIGNKGYAKGKVKIIPFDVQADLTKMIEEMEKGDILVSGSTGPEMIKACRKAGAIITEEGGILSHAAIISRELGIPCIIGTKIATKVLKDSDLVEVDADKGVVKILKRS